MLKDGVANFMHEYDISSKPNRMVRIGKDAGPRRICRANVKATTLDTRISQRRLYYENTKCSQKSAKDISRTARTVRKRSGLSENSRRHFALFSWGCLDINRRPDGLKIGFPLHRFLMSNLFQFVQEVTNLSNQHHVFAVGLLQLFTSKFIPNQRRHVRIFEMLGSLRRRCEKGLRHTKHG